MLGEMRSPPRWLFLVGLLAIGCGESNPNPSADGGTTGNPAQPTTLLDGGGGIEMPPDGAALCPAGACNYQSGEGCASGQACRPVLTNGQAQPGCVPAGSAEEGESCSEDNDCIARHLCAAGTCRRACCGDDWNACPEGRSCFVNRSFLIGGEPISTGVRVCAPVNECDPLDPVQTCTDGEECLVVDSRGSSACLPPGAGRAAEPCPCAGGFVCIAGSCRRLCRAVEGGGSPFCPPTEGICIHFDRNAEGVGECTPFRR